MSTIISTGRVFEKGDTISYRKKLKTPPLGTGRPYNVLNTTATVPPLGWLYIPTAGLTLRLSGTDSDGMDNSTGIATMKAGDTLVIGTASCVLSTPPLQRGSYFDILVVALPVVADGNYTCSVTVL